MRRGEDGDVVLGGRQRQATRLVGERGSGAPTPRGAAPAVAHEGLTPQGQGRSPERWQAAPPWSKAAGKAHSLSHSRGGGATPTAPHTSARAGFHTRRPRPQNDGWAPKVEAA